MTNRSPIFDALRIQLKNIPDKAEALCRVLDHQLYIRDRAHGDLIRRVERLEAKLAHIQPSEAE